MNGYKLPVRFVYGVVILLTLIMAGIVVRRTLQLAPVIANGYHPPAAKASSAIVAQLRQTDGLFARYPVLTLIHILPGLLFIVLGLFQFSRSIRARYPRWHRRSGRVVLVCGVITGVTALVMSFAMPSIGGVNQAAATTLFGLFFLLALYKAFRHIRRGNTALHREWMLRGYAIGLAVATIRPIVGVFFATSVFSGLTPHEFFGTGFWIGFVLHLILAEAWIYRTREERAAIPA